jgi:hypothetical protein
MPRNRKCLVCAKPFTPHHHQQVVCSDADCRKVRNQQRNAGRPNWRRYPHLNDSTVGAIGELRVSTDLLERGFDVFRALSPSASCDLAIIRDGKFLRVEVRTGHENGKGGFLVRRNGSYDIIAIVLPDRIVYEPALEDHMTVPEPQEPYRLAVQ